MCPWCSAPVNPVGHHAQCCAKIGSHARHTDLRDEFAALCVEADFPVELEKGPESLRPADVLMHGLGNSTLTVDFSAVHPLKPSADLAEVRLGKLARQVENQKVHAGSVYGLVLLPVRHRSHRRLGRQSSSFDVVSNTEVCPAA